jgi:hypothetical protein
MRIRCAAAVVAALAIGSVARAQNSDSLYVGDRVRVRSVSAPGTSSVFYGNISALSSDSLTLALDGRRGTVMLPRLGIAQIALSDGHESRLSKIGIPLLLTIPAAFQIHLATQSSAPAPLRVGSVVLVAVNVRLLQKMFSRPPIERWRPVSAWLDNR